MTLAPPPKINCPSRYSKHFRLSVLVISENTRLKIDILGRKQHFLSLKLGILIILGIGLCFV